MSKNENPDQDKVEIPRQVKVACKTVVNTVKPVGPKALGILRFADKLTGKLASKAGKKVGEHCVKAWEEANASTPKS